MLTVFIAVYFVLELGLYYNTRPRLANEIINFATQYATVQKKLLNEFEIPYALLDYTGKILWVNERFSELTGSSATMASRDTISAFPYIEPLISFTLLFFG